MSIDTEIAGGKCGVRGGGEERKRKRGDLWLSTLNIYTCFYERGKWFKINAARYVENEIFALFEAYVWNI